MIHRKCRPLDFWPRRNRRIFYEDQWPWRALTSLWEKEHVGKRLLLVHLIEELSNPYISIVFHIIWSLIDRNFAPRRQWPWIWEATGLGYWPRCDSDCLPVPYIHGFLDLGEAAARENFPIWLISWDTVYMWTSSIFGVGFRYLYILILYRWTFLQRILLIMIVCWI